MAQLLNHTEKKPTRGIETIINAPNTDRKPTICIIIGMAGTGKTRLMQRTAAYMNEKRVPSYIINLDPAVHKIPYEANIDIRDTVNYKNVMKQFGLGPNGGILTSLNLFATKFEDVIGLIHRRESTLDYIFIDTPGQIEVFTWSASGQIMTETLASTYPTCLLYVMDTVKCVDYVTFMSCMTYACSILYKTKLPFLIVFNKIDVQNHEFLIKWIQNTDEFEKHIDSEKESSKTYMTSLVKSLSLVLDAFYQNINTVGVSAETGQGIKQMFEKLEICRKEYFDEYVPMLKAKFLEREEKRKKEMKSKIAQITKETKEKEEIESMFNNNSNKNNKNVDGKERKSGGKSGSEETSHFEIEQVYPVKKENDSVRNALEPDGDEIVEMSDDDNNENDATGKDATSDDKQEEEQLMAFLNDTQS